MLSLPLITPRDSYELWFGSAQPYRSSPHNNQQPGDANQSHPRRNAQAPLNSRTLITSTAPANSLSALLLEERALRARKQNIAAFGYSWIRPAGCSKTMLGMKEEEAEREEALAAAAAEMAAAAAAADPSMDQQGEMDDDEQDEMMERDLDDDIPDADDADGLIEEGEEDLEEDDIVDEEDYIERDLDDDIPSANPYDDDDYDDEDEEQDDFDHQPDLDDDIPVADESHVMSEVMVRDLDDDVPEAAEEASQPAEEEEWQHTDTDAEFDDEEDSFANDPYAEPFRTSTTSSRGALPPPIRRPRETEAQRRFLQRWSGGGDAFDTSGMTLDDEDLRASVASQASRRSVFARTFSRRTGGPRDSLD